MERTWTVSIVGIIVALGGLGLIAVFFAIVGHFFKKSSQKRQKKETPKVASTTSSSVAETSEKKSTVLTKTMNEFDEDEEIVAVISAALTAYTPVKGKVVSIKRVERKANNLWRLHNAQNVWRIKRK